PPFAPARLAPRPSHTPGRQRRSVTSGLCPAAKFSSERFSSRSIRSADSPVARRHSPAARAIAANSEASSCPRAPTMRRGTITRWSFSSRCCLQLLLPLKLLAQNLPALLFGCAGILVLNSGERDSAGRLKELLARQHFSRG